MTLKLDGTVVEHNTADEGGGAIFFLGKGKPVTTGSTIG